MPVRNSAKALVLHEGKLLLNKCLSRFGSYYALPGGGQNDGERLEDAVVRELLEETGLTVRPVRLSAVYEHISENREDGVNHKIYFIFLCRLVNVPACEPTERDSFQIGMEWVPVSEARQVNLFPRVVRDHIKELIGYGDTVFLGSDRRK